MERGLKLLQELKERFGVKARDISVTGGVARVGHLHFRLDDTGTLRVYAGAHEGWVVARNLTQLSEVLIGATRLTPPDR